MVFKKFLLFFVIFVCVYESCGQMFEDSKCKIRDTNVPGICTLIEHCSSAREGIPRGEYPQICAFRGHMPIICCTDKDLTRINNETKITNDRNQVAEATTIGIPSTLSTTTKRSPTISTETWETSSRKSETIGTTSKRPITVETSTQKPISISSGTEKVPIKKLPYGEISKQKCLEYSQLANVDNCKIQTSDLFFKNVTQKGEFPHQALLGYDAPDGRKIWKCSGTLISERYILTAARCIHQLNKIKYVRLGDITSQAPNGIDLQEHKIEKIITHPEYQHPVTYNDIALIKLSENVVFNEKIRPVCLQVQQYIDIPEPTRKYVAIIWNRNQVSKLKIENVDMKCSKIYEDELFSVLTLGIIPDLQICASPSVNGACQNSENDLAGGPIQIPHPDVPCSYELVAVTSNAIPCGTTKPIPGIYTRIPYYIDWIENIVWYS